MADPILESRGLKLVPFHQRHILPFIRNMSAENLREFETLYEISPLEALYDLAPDELVFVIEKDDKPIAMTGIVLREDSGMMWALFSNDLRKNWISFARASDMLIQFYHTIRETIYSEVWTENEMIHQWLAYLGFEPECLIEKQNGQSVIRFVRCQLESNYVQGDTSRPVLH
jgi:hypothetical protein